MNTVYVERKFVLMGARFKKVPPTESHPWHRGPVDYAIDIGRDSQGEYFELSVPEILSESLELTVLQAKPRDRHLLLMVRKKQSPTIDRFLCGHDERSWFVAAVPSRASNVCDALEALKPETVRNAQVVHHVRGRKRQRRKNRAFKRQGEWFFVPANDLSVEEARVITNEPIQRGGGKPHVIDYIYRTGGESVYVCQFYPNGVVEDTYKELLRRDPHLRKQKWVVMRRNAGVFARGRVRHPDHATIVLHDWHAVFMNTESESRTMRNVAFLD